MKPQELTIGQLISEKRQLRVPVYQRSYEWTPESQLDRFFEQLKDQTKRIQDDSERLASHYMGTLLLISDRSDVQKLIHDIVDGQQRLTSFFLAIAALKDASRSFGLHSISSEFDRHIFNDTDIPDFRSKLVPNAKERGIFEDLLRLGLEGMKENGLYSQYFTSAGALKQKGGEIPKALRAYHWLQESFSRYLSDGREENIHTKANALLMALTDQFKLIVIELEEHDDPQVIFETLNTGAEPLAAMDLVRNFIFHRASKEGEASQITVENELSSKFAPDIFWRASIRQGRFNRKRLDHYLTHMLAAEMGKEISIHELYKEYKNFVGNSHDNQSVVDEVKTLTKYTETYKTISVGKSPINLDSTESDKALFWLKNTLEAFDVGTAVPIIFVTDTLPNITDHQKAEIYNAIESFIIRRAVCGLTTMGRNLFFASIARKLKNNPSSGFILDVLRQSDSDTTRFPDNHEFRKAFFEKEVYKTLRSKRVGLLLRRIEQQSLTDHDERDNLAENLTVEHVMPQKWYENWPLPNGDIYSPSDVYSHEMKEVANQRESLIHTFGNLTLLASKTNPTLGNSNFETKKQKRFGISKLKMNLEISNEEIWDVEQILSRTQRLYNQAENIWRKIK